MWYTRRIMRGLHLTLAPSQIRRCSPGACPQKGVPFSERKMAIPGDSGLPSRPTEQYREPIRQVGPEECWFCLSNPQCAKVSVRCEIHIADLCRQTLN